MWSFSMEKKIFAVLCVFLVFLCGMFLLFSSPNESDMPVVTLTENRDITAETDSDGDGVPDWLERGQRHRCL